MTNVVLAGGGTAGHTSPLIATADRIRELDPSGTLTCMGTARGLETRVIPAAGLELELIPPVPLPRKPTPDLLRVPGRLAASVSKARAILKRHDADVLVGFGGYVSLPGYLAAKGLRLPVVIHEQNAVPGLANKVASRFTRQVYVSFPDTPLPGARYIGMPLRRQITDLDVPTVRPGARAAFELREDLPVLLVSGGSQGARSINTALADARERILAAGVQILHVLGPKNFGDEHRSILDEGTGAAYRPVAYVDAMEQAYAAADLMVGRSGAGTVIETAVVGLPTIFVPLPHGNGEQARNAEALVAAGGAELVADHQLTGDRLAELVIALAHDTERLASMRAAGHGLVPADAAEVLAHQVLEVAR